MIIDSCWIVVMIHSGHAYYFEYAQNVSLSGIPKLYHSMGMPVEMYHFLEKNKRIAISR